MQEGVGEEEEFYQQAVLKFRPSTDFQTAAWALQHAHCKWFSLKDQLELNSSNFNSGYQLICNLKLFFSFASLFYPYCWVKNSIQVIFHPSHSQNLQVPNKLVF